MFRDSIASLKYALSLSRRKICKDSTVFKVVTTIIKRLI
jgi:hypothetical protein